MQLGTQRGRRFLVLSPADNVATLMDEDAGIACLSDGMTIADKVPFGHKVSLRAIARGEAVVKYGIRIGVATHPIEQGEHVHVHNCE
ncbi:MAG: UxaA family hydrolase [Rhodobiaceae bacterium]|jgi:altronate dehydratase